MNVNQVAIRFPTKTSPPIGITFFNSIIIIVLAQIQAQTIMIRLAVRTGSRGAASPSFMRSNVLPQSNAPVNCIRTISTAMHHSARVGLQQTRVLISPRLVSTTSTGTGTGTLLQRRSYVTDDSGFHPDFKNKLKNEPSGVLERIKQKKFLSPLHFLVEKKKKKTQILNCCCRMC